MKIGKGRFDHNTTSGYTGNMQLWFVYLLRCADNSLYCGITTDVKRRLTQHNSGTASKYTRSRLPVSLETYTEIANKSQALKLELLIKKMKSNKKISYLKSLTSVAST